VREDGAPALPEAALAAGEGEEEAESEQDGEEGEDQAARGDQQGSGDRRRRRGRRGGRRRRGNGEEGLAGSISDELAANAPSEATDAVADFDEAGGEAAPSIAHSEAINAVEPQVPQPEPRDAEMQAAPAQPEPAPAVAEEEPADDKAARRRSTVREKVSFLSSSASEPAAPVAQATEPVAPPVPAPEPAPEAASESSAPRRAGWWSRRFGGGE
jgi:ribonuclease E